ncbi:hypothetical protein MRB53_006519 [Persea americana]|uniref:Uncharacterized protein n=1 Tax=Persea americana TaxID=3435 RepID=A0ACC2MG80_PERAE|nr:hypothetical protein MRB53_006519 [Persea americana]
MATISLPSAGNLATRRTSFILPPCQINPTQLLPLVQFLTIYFTNPADGCKGLLFGIYGSTNYIQIRELWHYLSTNYDTKLRWCILGDFNAILLASEQLSFKHSWFVQDFQHLILSSGLQDMGFTGNIFTWSNNRKGRACVAARLDTTLCSSKWYSSFNDPVLAHLSKVLFDHWPLFLSHK